MCLRRICFLRRRFYALLLLPLVSIGLFLIILNGYEYRAKDAEAIKRIPDLRIADKPVSVSRSKVPEIVEPRNAIHWNMDQRNTERNVLERRAVNDRTTEPSIMDYRNMHRSNTFPNIMKPKYTFHENKYQKVAEHISVDHWNENHSITELRNIERYLNASNIIQHGTTYDPLIRLDRKSVPLLDSHSSINHEISKPTVLESIIARSAKQRGINPPKHPKMIRTDWQSVSSIHEIFLYSAYLDDRATLKQPFIRLIGVADTRAKHSALYCLLWYSSRNTPEVTSIEMKSVGPDIRLGDGRTFGQYIFSCRVPVDAATPGNVRVTGDVPSSTWTPGDVPGSTWVPGDVPASTWVPRNVSVVTSHDIQPTNVLEVQVPVRLVDPSEVLEFGHCMSIVYWQRDPLLVVEWLELHRIFGVAEINIYGQSLDNTTMDVLRRYHRTGFVRFRDISTVVDEPGEWPILLDMSPVINDCLYRNLYRFKYTVCTDFDEMIVPRGTHRTYKEMIDAAKMKVQSTSGSRFPIKSFGFRNVYFFLDFGPVLPDPWYLVTPRYQTRVHPSRYGYSFKSITRTLDCLGLQNHYCWEPLDGDKSHPGWNVDVDVKTGMNHHYKKCHFDRYLHEDGVCLRLMAESFRDRTMEKFKDELDMKVPEVLVELDLVDTRVVESAAPGII